jgi:hypothetical protein
MQFMHISTNNNFNLTKDTFVKPQLHKNGAYSQHSFNIDGALYLSKVNNTESSLWLKYIETELKNNEYTDINYYNKMLNGKKYYFNVDFNKDKIYLIDSVDKLTKLFINYGNFQQYISDLSYSTKEQNTLINILKNNDVLDNFIFNLDNNYKYILNNKHITSVMKSRNVRNMPFITIKNKQVVIPKKGITFTFLVDLLRTKNYYNKIINKLKEQKISIITTLVSLDFKKLAFDGYNGLYYSTNLINKEIELILPKFISYCSKEDLYTIEKQIKSYIHWLGSDTLIIWNWIW